MLEISGISKRFGNLQANQDLTFSLGRGEVLALLGENGAGKTTLMNILFGHYVADSGEIRLDGQQLQQGSPAVALDAGVGMVHQHFMLVPVFSVTENVILGNEPTTAVNRINLKEAREKVQNISSKYTLIRDSIYSSFF